MKHLEPLLPLRSYVLQSNEYPMGNCEPKDFDSVHSIYVDGGLITGDNASTWGGTWACIGVDEFGRPVFENSGLVIPTAPKEGTVIDLLSRKEVDSIGHFVEIVELPAISNNMSEFVAMLRCLEALPEGWCGYIYGDSQITLARFFPHFYKIKTNIKAEPIPDFDMKKVEKKKGGWKLKNVPPSYVERMRAAVDRLGACAPMLLDGHPIKAQLARGSGKRGQPISYWNKRCDSLCGWRSDFYKEFMAEHGYEVVALGDYNLDED